MIAEFDLKRIYWHEKTPKEIAEWVSKFQDKKLQLIVLPTSKNTADFIIRDLPFITKNGR